VVRSVTTKELPVAALDPRATHGRRSGPLRKVWRLTSPGGLGVVSISVNPVSPDDTEPRHGGLRGSSRSTIRHRPRGQSATCRS
jgi:hypothetical protein